MTVYFNPTGAKTPRHFIILLSVREQDVVDSPTWYAYPIRWLYDIYISADERWGDLIGQDGYHCIRADTINGRRPVPDPEWTHSSVAFDELLQKRNQLQRDGII